MTDDHHLGPSLFVKEWMYQDVIRPWHLSLSIHITPISLITTWIWVVGGVLGLPGILGPWVYLELSHPCRIWKSTGLPEPRRRCCQSVRDHTFSLMNREFIDLLKMTILKLPYDALCLVFPHLQGYDVIASPLQRPRRSLASVLADLSCLHQVSVMLVGWWLSMRGKLNRHSSSPSAIQLAYVLRNQGW